MFMCRGQPLHFALQLQELGEKVRDRKAGSSALAKIVLNVVINVLLLMCLGRVAAVKVII